MEFPWRRLDRMHVLECLASGLDFAETASLLGVQEKEIRDFTAPAQGMTALAVATVLMTALLDMRTLNPQEGNAQAGYKAQAERTKLMRIVLDAAKQLSLSPPPRLKPGDLLNGNSFLGRDAHER